MTLPIVGLGKPAHHVSAEYYYRIQSRRFRSLSRLRPRSTTCQQDSSVTGSRRVPSEDTNSD